MKSRFFQIAFASSQKTVTFPNRRNEDIERMIENEEKRSTALPGFAGLGLILTGIAGLIGAFSGGGGLSLLASAFAFGIVFYVCFK